MPVKLPLAEFRPDSSGPDTGYTDKARNVYPTALGCRPIQALASYTAALPTTVWGFINCQTSDGDIRLFAATATKLWKYNAATLSWDDASLGAGTYTGPGADENWSFAVFYGYLYAVNANDDMQRIDIDAGSAFAAVGGSPPRGKYLAVFEDYLVVGSLTTNPNEIAWCDTGDATNWSTGNSGEQIFADGGPVTGFAPAAKRVIQQRAERAMIHQPGGSPVFAFEKSVNARGFFPLSIIEVGDQYGGLAEDGFYWNGQPIGKERVDQYFTNLANTDRLFSVMGSFDPLRRLLRWAFHTGGGDAYDWQLIYAPTVDRWSEAVDNVTFIGAVATPGISLEALDGLYATLEDVAFSLDSRVWQGGRPTFVAFGTDNKLGFYEGDNLAAEIETTEANLIPGWCASVHGVRPIITGDTGAATTARLGTRMRLADAVSYGAYSSLQLSGRIPLRKMGRYHRIGIALGAGEAWTQALGIEIEDRDVVKRGLR